MRFYQIDLFRDGIHKESHQVSSTSNIKAVLLAVYCRSLGATPAMWWACKKLGWGQAWSTRPSIGRAEWEIQISQLHDEEFRDMKVQQRAHVQRHGPYLLPERRAA
jgi:hypothetical protein